MYYALRPMKIKKDDGHYEMRKAGDAVPEAYGWKENVLVAHLSARHMEDRQEGANSAKIVREPEVKKSEPVSVNVSQVEADSDKPKRGRPKKVQE